MAVYDDPFEEAMIAPLGMEPDPMYPPEPDMPDHFLDAMAPPPPMADPDAISGDVEPEPEPWAALPEGALSEPAGFGESAQLSLETPRGLPDAPTDEAAEPVSPLEQRFGSVRGVMAQANPEFQGTYTDEKGEFIDDEAAQFAEEAKADGTFYTDHDRQVDDVLGMGQGEYLRWKSDRGERLAEASREGIKAAEDRNAIDRAEAQENLAKVRAEVAAERADITREARDIAGRKINQDRWMSSRSGGQQLAMLIGAMLGGWVDPKGPNQMIKLAMSRIDQDIEIQRADIANARQGVKDRRGLVADLMAGGMDEYKAAETARLAMQETMLSELKTKIAGMDPAGSQAIKLREQVQTLEMARAAAQEKADNKRFEQTLKLGQFRQKAISDDAKLWQYDTKRGLWTHPDGRSSRTAPAGGGGGRAAGTATGAGLDKDGFASALDRHGVPAKARGRAVFLGEGGAEDPPILMGTREEASKFKRQLAASRTLTNLVSSIARAREKHGWELDSKYWTTDDGQRQLSKYAAAMLAYKEAYELGAISESDLKLVEGGLGGNPNAVKTATALLDQTVENIQMSLNQKLKPHGYGHRKVSLPIYRATKRVESDTKGDLSYIGRTTNADGSLNSPESRVSRAKQATESILKDESTADRGGGKAAGGTQASRFNDKLQVVTKERDALAARLAERRANLPPGGPEREKALAANAADQDVLQELGLQIQSLRQVQEREHGVRTGPKWDKIRDNR